ncbi:PQQ-binding-like beta-propeller repeat protein [Chitinophaga polysaccharea]|uniref:outer membrane protein assembly factor BamB family protein n=1 Tax=Chitinophaga polysaccharea TaxID=1293035 RepID=UPI001455BD3D|nr:PQQ-binding-like beta-propeller repeat protein [Chitinophaga polysaccharea]NLR58355.1 PQQ-binding-like beta-propeller repeat protein [Chitinophaga polysaccharea]
MRSTPLRWLLLSTLWAACTLQDKSHHTWQVYGGSKENIHYSSLTALDTSNVSLLKVAWAYHTGDAKEMTQMQVNPIVVDDRLYGVSAGLKLFAVDAATGKEMWVFDPHTRPSNTCRGVAFYDNGSSDQRLFYTVGARLYCINAATGRPITTFADSGFVDLHRDMGWNMDGMYITSTTPGIIYKDLIIIGTRVSEEAGGAPGYIRAYDVHSGRRKWIFHTIPQPGEPGYESWQDTAAWRHTGGANAWAGFSLDEQNGVVFAPVGSASYDFYGGKRKGNNLFANCVLALDAATGKRIWHYQTVHHDVWDRDLPTAPMLLTVKKEGKPIDAVVQVTKTGFIFLLDKKTGLPLYPVTETPVPGDTALPGELLSPTQPVPTFFAPFVRQSLEEQDLNHLVSDASYADIRARLASYKKGHLFMPPSRQGTVIFPGFDGGSEWGGPAADPATGILYVNANEMPWVLTMVDADAKPVAGKETQLQAGKRLYTAHCMVCHGPERKGGGNFPSLLDIHQRYDEKGFTQLVDAGRRMMPAFKQLDSSEKHALATFILDLKTQQQSTFVAVQKKSDPYVDLPYRATGYNKFLTKEGYPAVSPPWGTLSAIDLNTGKLLWKDTLGDYPELKARGIHSGTENYGGPVVTAGGLLFIAATADSKFRAFNKRTGQLLWETTLPACGFATPAVYEVKGKQYVVISCGGGKLGKPSGDTYLAFSL